MKNILFIVYIAIATTSFGQEYTYGRDVERQQNFREDCYFSDTLYSAGVMKVSGYTSTTSSDSIFSIEDKIVKVFTGGITPLSDSSKWGFSSTDIYPLNSGRVLLNTGSADNVSAGGLLDVNTTQIGNVTTGVDNLITYSLTASTLSANGDIFYFSGAGITAANGQSKQILVVFGSTTLHDTGVVTWNDKDWSFEGWIIRTGASSAYACVNFTANATSNTTFTEPAENLASTLTFKLTGEATSTNDIIQKYLLVNYNPQN